MIIFKHYNQLLLMIRPLHSSVEEPCDTSDSQANYFDSFPFILMYYSGTIYSPFNTSLPFQNIIRQTEISRCDQQFLQRSSTNIILHEDKQPAQIASEEQLAAKKKGKKISKKVEKRPPIQKQSRNVLSNILRIFFKSALQAKTYDSMIEGIIQKQNLSANKEEFISWMFGFGVNYKNYIQNSQMKRMFAPSQSESYRSILIIIMRHYLKNYGMSHCMTSKKIELKALRMHLSGLKELQSRFIEMYSQRK